MSQSIEQTPALTAKNTTTCGVPFASAVLAVVVLGVAMLACKQGDPAACQTAQQNVRALIKTRKWDAIAPQRDYAYKVCEDRGPLGALDQEVVAGKAQEQKEKAEAAARIAKQKAAVDAFVAFVGEKKDAPETTSVNVSCEGDKMAELTKERWCVRRRQAGEYTFEARYWEKDPKAVRFSFAPPFPASCEDLGGTLNGKWAMANHPQITRQHCSFGAGGLAGLSGLLMMTTPGKVEVFKPEYLKADTAMAARIESKQ